MSHSELHPLNKKQYLAPDGKWYHCVYCYRAKRKEDQK